jgi:predicted glycosyltransferase involved in capsule biosynthesis
MMLQYETEQHRLQQDLQDAYHLNKKEEQKRIQLEEEMRRMFLKNLTNMNKEALSITIIFKIIYFYMTSNS